MMVKDTKQCTVEAMKPVSAYLFFILYFYLSCSAPALHFRNIYKKDKV
jgi:hypothetical protein